MRCHAVCNERGVLQVCINMIFKYNKAHIVASLVDRANMAVFIESSSAKFKV